MTNHTPRLTPIQHKYQTAAAAAAEKKQPNNAAAAVEKPRTWRSNLVQMYFNCILLLLFLNFCALCALVLK